jgi:uncharacterized phiE125 gp8 family phage protein
MSTLYGGGVGTYGCGWASLLVAPIEEPVALDDLLLHCRVDSALDASQVEAYGLAARHWVEQVTKRQLLTATWRYTLATLPLVDTLWLPKPPLQSVETVTYVDTAGVTQTLDTATYVVETAPLPGHLRLAYGQRWPGVQAGPGAVQVDFIAGWDDVLRVPPPLLQAIRLLTAHWFERRESTHEGPPLAEIPHGVLALVTPYKVVDFY